MIGHRTRARLVALEKSTPARTVDPAGDGPRIADTARVAAGAKVTGGGRVGGPGRGGAEGRAGGDERQHERADGGDSGESQAVTDGH